MTVAWLMKAGSGSCCDQPGGSASHAADTRMPRLLLAHPCRKDMKWNRREWVATTAQGRPSVVWPCVTVMSKHGALV
jgi:hypothetical protein